MVDSNDGAAATAARAAEASAREQRQRAAWQALTVLVKAEDSRDKANGVFSLLSSSSFEINEQPNVPIGKAGAEKMVNRNEFLALQAARLIPHRAPESRYNDWQHCLMSTSSSPTPEVAVNIAKQALNYAKTAADVDIPVGMTKELVEYSDEEKRAGAHGKKSVPKAVLGSANQEIANAAIIYSAGKPGGALIREEAVSFIESRGGEAGQARAKFWRNNSASATPEASQSR
jgi:hypothetical protein